MLPCPPSVDILCVNQNEGLPPVDLQTVYSIIDSCHRTFLVLDRFGTVFSRAWCLWEVMMTLRQDKYGRELC